MSGERNFDPTTEANGGREQAFKRIWTNLLIFVALLAGASLIFAVLACVFLLILAHGH